MALLVKRIIFSSSYTSAHHLASGRPASIAVVGTTATTPRDRSISMMSNLSPNRSDIYGQPAIVYPYLQVNIYL